MATFITQMAAGAITHTLASTLGSPSPAHLDDQENKPQTTKHAEHAVAEPVSNSAEALATSIRDMNCNGDENENDASTPTTGTLSSQVLPLTPTSQSDKSAGADRATPKPTMNNVTDQIPASADPVNKQINQRSPPTPDDTPPRRKSKIPGSQAPPPTQRYPSSRADSFTTARENLSSDDEGNKAPSSAGETPTQAMQNWLDTTRAARLESIGLGLEAEPYKHEDENKTPQFNSPTDSPKDNKISGIDGAWSHQPEEGTEATPTEWNTNISRNVTLRRKSGKRQDLKAEAENLRQSWLMHKKHPEAEESSLQERDENQRLDSRNGSMERFAKEIEWPFKDDGAGNGFLSKSFDSRRSSAISTTSTVVEVMVFDIPRQRRRTLRHTGKNLALRISDPSPQAARRSHQDIGKRLSQPEPKVSKSSDSHGLHLPGPLHLYGSRPTSVIQAKREGAIPVVVIPERRSSLRSSANSSRQQSRAPSLVSRDTLDNIRVSDDGIAATSLPGDNLIGSANPKTKSSGDDDPHAKDEPLTNVTETKSLQPAEIISIIRTPSLASGSPEIHKDKRKREHRSAERVAVSSPKLTEHDGEKSIVQLSPDVNGERSLSWHTSAYPTPFSQASMTSSTEGLEVREATAVSIFPHHNHSLLVVQQFARPQPRSRPSMHSSPGLETISIGSPKGAEDFSSTGHPLSLVQSPLKNPRAAPAPPAFQIIPPTPADEADRQIGSRDSSSTGPTRAFSMVRRALTTRRFSDSIVSPFARLQTYKNASGDEKRRVPSVSEDTDNRLHPFWRPRGFWDDLEESDPELDREMEMDGGLRNIDQIGHGEQDVLNGAPLTDYQDPHASSLRRRWGTLRNNRNNNHRSNNTTELRPATVKMNRMASNGSMHSTTKPGIARSYSVTYARQQRAGRPRSTSIPALGIQIEYVGFKGLKERLRERKERKAEEAREERREKIKRSIGPRIITPDYGY